MSKITQFVKSNQKIFYFLGLAVLVFIIFNSLNYSYREGLTTRPATTTKPSLKATAMATTRPVITTTTAAATTKPMRASPTPTLTKSTLTSAPPLKQ